MYNSEIMTEKEISETFARFSAVIQNYPGVIWCVNNDGRFTLMEGLELKEMGLSAADAIGNKMSDVLGKYPDMLDKLEKTFSDGPQNWTYTASDRYYSFSTYFITDKDGSQVGIICTATDITENIKIQEQLVAAMEKAENANKAKSEFLSRMSHEIRTPINAIIGMTKIALHSGEPQKMLNSLEKIDAASDQLLGIINDILDMSKIEAHKFEINNEPFDFKAMIDRIYNMIIVKTDEKNIKFELDIDDGAINNYIGDELRLTQVIINLLSNAVKFTPADGVIKFSADIAADLSSQSSSKSDADCMLIEFKVTDSGIGISKEQQSKLFNSFEQADGTIARKYGGTGLGLAICKKIVGLMDGDIYVESEAGKGSSFIFTVKLKKTDIKIEHSSGIETDGTEAGSLDNNDFSDYHIILAEDVELNREVVLALLEDTKLNIDCAENGEEAYKLFLGNQEKYDLIFMDIQMPVMDGYESTKKIRAIKTEKAANIPIIAMTANAFQEDIDASKKAGMNSHISKPIDLSVIMDKLREFLNYSRNMHASVSPLPEPEVQAAAKPGKKTNQPVKAEMLLPDINLEDGLERISGNKKLFVSLLKNFKGKELFDRLVAEFDKGEIKECIHSAHNLKESGEHLGLPVLYSAALEIESALISTGVLLDPEHITELKNSLDSVLEKINLVAENGLE